MNFSPERTWNGLDSVLEARGRGAQQSSGANICVQCSHHRDDPGHLPGSSSPDAGVWGFIPLRLCLGRHGSDPNRRQTLCRQSGHRRVRIRVSLKHVFRGRAGAQRPAWPLSLAELEFLAGLPSAVVGAAFGAPVTHGEPCFGAPPPAGAQASPSSRILRADPAPPVSRCGDSRVPIPSLSRGRSLWRQGPPPKKVRVEELTGEGLLVTFIQPAPHPAATPPPPDKVAPPPTEQVVWTGQEGQGSVPG